MLAFFDYLRNITYYLVFMAAVGVIVPSGNYKKYIALVMGILLIGIFLDPISMIISREQIAMTEVFGNIVPIPMAGQSDHSDHLRAAFHAQLTAQADALLARSGFLLVSADWETSEDFTYIQRVSLTAQAVEAEPTPVPFIRVEPVRIAPYQPSEETEEARAVKILISDFYDMSMDNIHVEIL